MLAGNDLSVEVLSGLAGLNSIEADWHALTKAMESPFYFHQYGFHKSFIESVESNPDAVFFFLIREGASPVAIIPLVRRVKIVAGVSIRVLGLYPDDMHLEGLTDCITTRPDLPLGAMFEQGLASCAEGWDVVLALRCCENASFLQLLAQLPRLRCSSVLAGANAWVPRHELDAVAEKMRTRRRSRCNRNLRRLAKLGEVDYLVANTLDELREAYPRFLALEDSGWKGELSTSIISDSRFTKFYANLLEAYGQENCCEIILLTLNGQAVAGQFVLYSGDNCFLPKIAYREEYSWMGPGRILCEKLFQRLSETGDWRSCNFIASPVWLDSWEHETMNTYMACVFNQTLRGRAVAIGLKARQVLKPMLKSIRRKHPEHPQPDPNTEDESSSD